MRSRRMKQVLVYQINFLVSKIDKNCEISKDEMFELLGSFCRENGLPQPSLFNLEYLLKLCYQKKLIKAERFRDHEGRYSRNEKEVCGYLCTHCHSLIRVPLVFPAKEGKVPETKYRCLPCHQLIERGELPLFP